MKIKQLLPAAILLIANWQFSNVKCFSQNIGINSTGAAPNASAGLDVSYPNKGVLVPRVALTSSTDAATIAAPATSVLVYNLGTGGLSPAGYYYNSGTPGSPVWSQLLNGGTSFCGSAAANYVTKFTSASAICNSIIYDNGTNVGIGTAIPGAKLDVLGNVRAGSATPNAYMGTHPTYGNGFAAWWKDGVDYSMLTDGSNSFFNAPAAAGNIYFRTANADKMFIRGTDGFVGIGTTAPVSTLDVLGGNSTAALNSSAGALATFTSNTTVQLQFGAINGGSYAAWIQSKVDGQNAAYPIALQPAGGNVGIGTTTPAATLEVDGEIRFVNGTGSTFWSNTAQRDFDVIQSNTSTNRAFTVHSGSSSGSAFGNIVVDFYGNDGAGNNLPGITMLKNCNVGIGITTPAQRLDVNGEIIAAEGIPNVTCTPINAGYSFENDGCYDTGMFSPADGDLRFYSNDQLAEQIVGTNIYASNDIYLGACGGWLTGLYGCSDIRYKKDIVPMKNVLPDVIKLQGVKYNWRQDEFPAMNFNDRRQIGFIAQEMEKVFPEIVNTNDKGYKNIDYAKLTPVLVEAIKEQQKTIDSQQSAINRMQTENQNLKTEISTLKSDYDNRLKKIEELLGVNLPAGITTKTEAKK